MNVEPLDSFIIRPSLAGRQAFLPTEALNESLQLFVRKKCPFDKSFLATKQRVGFMLLLKSLLTHQSKMPLVIYFQCDKIGAFSKPILGNQWFSKYQFVGVIFDALEQFHFGQK